MIVQLKKGPEAQASIDQLTQMIHEVGARPNISEGSTVFVIGVEGGDTTRLNEDQVWGLNGVIEVYRLTGDYKIVARTVGNGDGKSHTRENTIVDVAGRKIGGEKIIYIAGPCAVESRDQILRIAEALYQVGQSEGILDQMILRGGAWKPRKSRYTFQGLGMEAIEYLVEARTQTGIPIALEVTDPRYVTQIVDQVDLMWVGARKCLDYDLLQELGRQRKPVMHKRGISGVDVDSWLAAAEYIAYEGNTQVVLCERGESDGRSHHRNNLDYDLISAVKEKSHLPIIVDPSHGTGKVDLVPRAAKAAVREYGANGTIIEVICDDTDRSRVLCDGAQALTISQYSQLVRELQGQ